MATVTPSTNPPHHEPARSHQNDTVNGARPLPGGHPQRRVTHAAARWDRLVASYHAQHDADQQARTDALLLEVIDVLARLLNSRDHLGNHNHTV